MAEATGLIRPLGRWVLEEACRQAKLWNDGRHRQLLMSVNLSALQLQHGEGLLRETAHALEASGIGSDLVVLEVSPGRC